MNRITPKEVTSMMQAVAQVYEQPEQSEDNTILEFENIEDYEETPAQKNARVQRENERKLEAMRRQRRKNRMRDDDLGLKPTSANLPSDYKETELQAGRDAEKSRTGAGLPQSGGGNQASMRR